MSKATKILGLITEENNFRWVSKSYEPNKGEYRITIPNAKKVRELNSRTNRKKNFKRCAFAITNISPEKRTLGNLPRYADKKSRIPFWLWLELKKSPVLSDKNNDCSWGRSPSGCVFGWSHRAVGEFYKGKKISSSETIGHKYSKNNFKPYTINTDKEAEEHAKRFAKEVS